MTPDYLQLTPFCRYFSFVAASSSSFSKIVFLCCCHFGLGVVLATCHDRYGPFAAYAALPRLITSCFWMGGCIFHYNQDHQLNSGSITDLVCLTHDPDDNAALVGLIGCSFRFRGYAPAELEITIRIDHSSMNTYTHCCASKLCFALPCCRDVTRGAPSPESNDPTCGGSDGGTGVTAPPPPCRPPPPRA